MLSGGGLERGNRDQQKGLSTHIIHACGAGGKEKECTPRMTGLVGGRLGSRVRRLGMGLLHGKTRRSIYRSRDVHVMNNKGAENQRREGGNKAESTIFQAMIVVVLKGLHLQFIPLPSASLCFFHSSPRPSLPPRLAYCLFGRN